MEAKEKRERKKRRRKLEKPIDFGGGNSFERREMTFSMCESTINQPAETKVGKKDSCMQLALPISKDLESHL